MSRSRSTLAGVVAVGVVLAGCGADDAKRSAATSSTASTSTAAPRATDATAGTTTSAAPSRAGSAVDLPQLADATYTTGRVHLELSGDVADAFESDGTGQTVAGTTSAAFALDDGRLVTVAFGAGTDGAIAVTAAGVATTAAFGKDCDVEFGGSDGSRVEATFDCPSVAAVASTDVKTVSITGNFWLAT